MPNHWFYWTRLPLSFQQLCWHLVSGAFGCHQISLSNLTGCLLFFSCVNRGQKEVRGQHWINSDWNSGFRKCVCVCFPSDEEGGEKKWKYEVMFQGKHWRWIEKCPKVTPVFSFSIYRTKSELGSDLSPLVWKCVVIKTLSERRMAGILAYFVRIIPTIPCWSILSKALLWSHYDSFEVKCAGCVSSIQNFFFFCLTTRLQDSGTLISRQNAKLTLISKHLQQSNLFLNLFCPQSR